jgi:hypothetical protein
LRNGTSAGSRWPRKDTECKTRAGIEFTYTWTNSPIFSSASQSWTRLPKNCWDSESLSLIEICCY